MAKALRGTEKTITTELKDAVIRECQNLYATKGLVKAEDLVAIARDPNSPLHDTFEWDDDVAAQKYREVQARTLIKIVTVELANGNTVPNYVNVKMETPEGKTQRGYVPLSFAMKHESLREQILKEAIKEIRLWETRYKDYSSLSGVVNENKVEELESELEL